MLNLNPTVEEVREYSAHVTERRNDLQARGWTADSGSGSVDLVAENFPIDCARCGDVARVHLSYFEDAGKEPTCPSGIEYCSCYIPLFDQLELYLCTGCAHQIAPGVVRALATRDALAKLLDDWSDREEAPDPDFEQDILDELGRAAREVKAAAELLFRAAGLDEPTLRLAIEDTGTVLISVRPVQTAA